MFLNPSKHVIEDFRKNITHLSIFKNPKVDENIDKIKTLSIGDNNNSLLINFTLVIKVRFIKN